MPDKERITTLDVRLAHEEWRRQMDENLANLRRLPVNRDPYIQAHLLNRFKDNDEYRAYRRVLPEKKETA